MKVNFKDFLWLLTPPWVTYLVRRLANRKVEHTYDLSGDYSSWGDAVADSTGYDSDVILEKTRVSLLKVKNGTAIYERDSVLFDEIQYAWPLLAGLIWVAARSDGKLNVIDFGGSLGSTYFQNRAFLAGLREVRWNIVEQAKQVEVGKEYFEGEQLKFYESVEECLAATQPTVILLSGVLQYLPNPYSTLDQLFDSPCEYLIIDRTPFLVGSNDRLCVQRVPPTIYAASYPSWIFSLEHFHDYLHPRWKIQAEFDGFDKLSTPEAIASWKGIIAVRRKEQMDLA